MATYAAIQGGVITNFVNWDGVTPYTPPGGVTLTLASSLTGVVQMGSTVVGSVCSAPTPVVQTTGLTFQQYSSLFTAAEFNAIATLATTNPGVFVGLMKAISFSGSIETACSSSTSSPRWSRRASSTPRARPRSAQALSSTQRHDDATD